MKITVFLLLFVTFQAYCENGYSQSSRVNIADANLKVSDLLSQIESQTDYLFVYNKENVDVKRRVDVRAENRPVSEVLDRAFEGTGIRYVMEGTNIVLTRKSVDNVLQQPTTITVKGTVVDQKGEPIIGASVLQKGTTNGIITDMDGNFTLKVPADAVISITYVGYQPQSISVNGQTTFNIKMQEENLTLEQVVVTAMGIKKKAASLTYSVQQVGGDDLTRVKDQNMINALEGKIAGVTIQRNSSGLGGSAKVSIRGIRSAYENGNNQPLYVIDGVPMLNSSNVQAVTVMGGDKDSGNRDSGDGISNLNPDDIQSISVLKGASAAALYGSQAANGVILITTKKGSSGSTNISYSSSLTFDKAMTLPEFQNSYNEKWEKEDGMKDYKYVNDFFSTGLTAINSLTLSTGNDKAQTYFSYANTTAKGIIDVNKLQKHNLTLRQTGKFFNDRLTLDGNVNLIRQSVKNRPTSGGLYLNPLPGLYTIPRGMDMSAYTSGEEFDNNRLMPRQVWWRNITDGLEGNPWWLVNRVTNKDVRTRTIASISANLKINDWISIQARGTADYISDHFEQQMWASTSTVLTGGDWDARTDNGRYAYTNRDEFMIYGDVMAMFNKTWKKISLNAAIGGSINSTKTNDLTMDSHLASLYRPNIFTPTNIRYANMATRDGSAEFNSREVMQSFFATAQIGYDEALYLDLTARNDWSSTLYGTKSFDTGFFYPSVGLSWLMHKSLSLPQWIDFAKIRGSFAEVGNTLPMYQANLYPTIGMGGNIIQVQYYNDGTLKPEISDSWEVGAEFKFLQSRLDVDFTWYKTITRNQFIRMPMLPGSLYSHQMVNAGKISNRGVELTVGGVPVEGEKFRWRTQVNFSTNKNKVDELTDTYKTFSYGQGVNMPYRMIVKEGGSLGDLYGNAFKRDESGKVVFDSNGFPEAIVDRQQYLGNSNPKCLLGWSNTFTIYDFTLNFLIDARIGGDVLSLTQSYLDAAGVSKNVGEALDKGYVEIDGRKIEGKENIQKFYSRVGDRNNGVSEYYMYKGTNVRLRELSIGYNLPQSWMQKTGVFKNINLSFVARNLFFFYKDAPFDPDNVLSVGNDMQGVDVYGMPSTRSIGFNVKFTF